MSARTGLAVEALSELKHAAEQSGSSIEALEKGVRTMQRVLTEARGGSQSANETLARLGLSIDALAGLNPEQQFLAIADALARVEDPTTRAALAMKVFGKSGTSLLPLLAGGAAGIADLREEARRLGLTIDGESAAAAERLGDELATLWKQVKAGAFAIGAALAPTLLALVQALQPVLAGAIAWIKENQALVTGLTIAAVTVGTVGAVLVTTGAAISLVAMALSGLAAVVPVVSAAFGVLTTVLGAIFTPVSLVVVAVAGLTAAVLYFSGAGGQALAWLKAQFGRLLDTARTVLDGIRDALASGNLELACRILWVGLRLEFEKGKNWLLGLWDDFVVGMLAKWEWLKGALAKGLLQVQSGFGLFFDSTGAQREVDAGTGRAIAQLEAGAAARLLDRQQGVRQAQAELEAARAEAAAAQGGRAGKANRIVHDFDPPAVAAAVEQAGSAAGAFSAGAAARLGFAGDAVQRIAQWTEDTAENTEALVKILRDGGTLFV
jgi:hypothetical protein